MPENKLQHYVPRVYLRPFTKDGKGKAVDLFHIKSERLIRKAEAKGQCAKDYFYGDDLVIEKALQEPEGHYARILTSLIVGDSLTSDDLSGLLVFFLLQSFRSYGQVERTMATGKLMTEGLEQRGSAGAVAFLQDWQEAVRFLLKTSLEVALDGYVEGLRLAIGRSISTAKFITSDDPAIHVNRYYSQRLKENSFGFGNTGLMFFLPLSPEFVFMAFDPHCYSCQAGKFVDLDKASVDAINHLQMISARHTIYVPPGYDENHFRRKFDKAKGIRPEVWSKTTYLVEDENRLGSFVPVPHIPRDGGFMQQIEMVKPVPAEWPRVLPFRQKIRSNRTGTAAGDIRIGVDVDLIRRKSRLRLS